MKDNLCYICGIKRKLTSIRSFELFIYVQSIILKDLRKKRQDLIDKEKKRQEDKVEKKGNCILRKISDSFLDSVHWYVFILAIAYCFFIDHCRKTSQGTHRKTESEFFFFWMLSFFIIFTLLFISIVDSCYYVFHFVTKK